MKTTLEKLGIAEDLVYIVKTIDNNIYTIGYLNQAGGGCDCCSVVDSRAEIEVLSIYIIKDGKLEQVNLENIK